MLAHSSDRLLGGAAAGRTSADRQSSSTHQDTTDAVLSSITFKTTHAEVTFPKTNHSTQTSPKQSPCTQLQQTVPSYVRSRDPNLQTGETIRGPGSSFCSEQRMKSTRYHDGRWLFPADECMLWSITAVVFKVTTLVPAWIWKTAAIVWFCDRRSLCDEGSLQQYTVCVSK